MNFHLLKNVHGVVRHDIGFVKAAPYLDVQVLGYVYDVKSETDEFLTGNLSCRKTN